MLRAIISQLDASGLLPHGLDPKDETVVNAVFNLAFFVLVQLEEADGIPEGDKRYFSHLVFTPKGDVPAETGHLISQMGRTFLHAGLTEAEVARAVAEYAAERDQQ